MLRTTATCHANREDRHSPVLAQGVADLLAALGNRYVAYYPTLADLSGSPKAALMLGHAMYMTRVVMDKQASRKGWFWKTSKEWKQVTGLSVEEIRSAKKLLLKDGILQESLRGMPAKLWYRVDLNKLAEKLCEYSNTKYRPWSWDDRVLKTLLGRPVMFYAPLAWVASSAIAGLYLSHLIGSLRQALQNNEVDRSGRFVTTMRHSQDRLYLGRHAVMHARAKLVSVGILEESREHRAQAKLISSINLAVLPQKIALKANEFHCLSEYDNQECRNTTIKTSGFPATRHPLSPQQDIRFPQNLTSAFPATSSGETGAFSYIELNTTYPTPHTAPGVVDLIDAQPKSQMLASTDLGSLFYPDKLLPNERLEAKRALTMNGGCPNPQKVLDEWAGQLQLGRVRNPIKYLMTLKSRDVDGTLLCDQAHRIAAERERRQQILTQRKTSVPDPVEAIDREQGRQRMAALRQMIWNRQA